VPLDSRKEEETIPQLKARNRDCQYSHASPMTFNTQHLLKDITVFYIHPSDHPSPVYSRSEVADILKRVRDSPAVTSEICSGPSTSFRGNLNRGSDSGWRRGFVPSRNFNYGSFRGGHNVSVFRGVNKILKTPSALGRVEDQDRASAIDNEGTGTAQDPILID